MAWWTIGRTTPKLENPSKEKTDVGKSKASAPPSGCFLSGGPHRIQECPKPEKLTALMAEQREEGEAPRVNPLQLLNVVCAQLNGGLMYVQILLNGRNVGAMVDTGATHNFVSQNEVGHYDIKLGEANHSLKAVNLDARPILGVGEATLKVGP